LVLSLILLVSVFTVTNLFAQYDYETMEQEQYNALLTEWQGRVDAASQGLTTETAAIDSLNAQLASLQSGVDAEWNEIYELAGTDKAGYDAYVGELQQLQNDARALVNLSPEDIYTRMNEVDDLQAKVDEAKKSPFAAVSDNEALIASIESLIAQAKEKGAAAVPPSYTVVRGDYLWKIAAKEDIYGDAYAWMRIYTSNRDMISDPNLIYPNQVFSIPRQVGPNEHLVARGEYLAKIAGYSNVYGSAFQWNKLYEANKSTISDPNMIYPYQVLKIAR
ncbi:MAG TPA: LysM peptidoglycan-binding domain-containing protein, partial [Caldithrix sp.]|nr:LysM peptidoglycan-binding domain-containing protein [Caldithrix sp.]